MVHFNCHVDLLRFTEDCRSPILCRLIKLSKPGEASFYSKRTTNKNDTLLSGPTSAFIHHLPHLTSDATFLNAGILKAECKSASRSLTTKSVDFLSPAPIKHYSSNSHYRKHSYPAPCLGQPLSYRQDQLSEVDPQHNEKRCRSPPH